MVSFDILGEPKAWARPRVMSHGHGKPHFFTKPEKEKATANMQAQICSQLPHGFIPLDGAIGARVVFRLPKPKSAKKGELWMAKSPDLDNFLKLLFDCMQGIVFEDDKRICSIDAMKIYDEVPGIFVKIEKLEGKP